MLFWERLSHTDYKSVKALELYVDHDTIGTGIADRQIGYGRTHLRERDTGLVLFIGRIPDPVSSMEQALIRNP